jgi:putative tryptophan/tyrosine transport system substrate-binding protein
VIRPREAIAVFGSGAAWPAVVRAQQSNMPVVGYVDGGSMGSSHETAAGVRHGLSEVGYVEG